MKQTIYEQKLSGRVAERLTVNHASGMAKIERLARSGAITSADTFSAGDGRVSRFIHQAEPRGRR